MNRVGQAGPIEGPATVRKDAQGNIVTQRTWTGTRAELQTLADSLGVEYTIAQDRGPVYKLTTNEAGNTAPGGPGIPTNPEELVVTVWDIKVAQHRRDLWELPIIATELKKLTEPSDRTRLLNLIKDFGRGELVYYTYSEKDGSLQSAQLTSAYIKEFSLSKGLNPVVMDAFLGEIARGVDSYLHNTFALSKKRTGPASAASLEVDFSLVNRALSTGTLLAREPSIPPAIAGPISRQLTVGAWIRQSDELNQLDAARVEISSQWIWAQDWSILIYGTAE